MSALNSARFFRDTSPGEFTTIHGVISPIDIRSGELVKAHIRFSGSSLDYQTYRVWRLSPLGVEIVMASDDPLYQKGTVIDLKMVIAGQVCHFGGVVVSSIVNDRGVCVVGVRLTSRIDSFVTEEERRNRQRWQCLEPFSPTGVAVNPALYNDFIYFKIADISQSGMRLITSLRNKYIIPQMHFESLVNFPMIGQVTVKFEVTRARAVSLAGKDVLELGAKILNFDRMLSETIGQYVLQFGPGVSPKELTRESLTARSISTAVDFQFVRNEEDYREVLDLRQRAYVAAGKVDPNSKAEDRSDIFDSRSRIVVGRYKGRVVASCRLIFSQAEDIMEQEQFVTFPADFPRRDEVVEITRACTDPDFRGGDLLISMCRFVALTVVQSRRNWIVICASDEMRPVYERMGYKKTEFTYEHPALGNLKHTVMYGNVAEALTGRGINPIIWNLLWADVSKYMLHYGIMSGDPLALTRIAIYRMFAPIANLVSKVMKLRGRKKLKSAV